MDSQLTQVSSTNQAKQDNPAAAKSSVTAAVASDPSVAKTAKPETLLPSAQPAPIEHKDITGSLFKEGEPRIIEKKEFIPPVEVKEWLEEVKTAEEIVLPEAVKDEYGEILMESAVPVKPKIVLPLSQPKAQQALHQKIADSIRWLAEWCLRILKMLPKRAEYKELT